MGSLNLTLDAPRVAAGLEDRSITGVAVPYREVGRTNVGAVSVAPGALRLPADVGAVKLFSDHGRATVVGYATAAADSPDRLEMTFHVAATPAGDTALLEAAERVRDALSVELSDVTIKAGVIVSASLDAVALVPLPAYRSARLMLAADTDLDAPAGAQGAAGAPSEPEPDTDDPAVDELVDAEPDNEETDAVTPTHPPTPAASPGVLAASPAAAIAAGIARLSTVVRGARDAAQVNAALSDIVPANDGGEGYLRHQWVDELWTPYYLEQFLTNAVTSATLTGDRVVGWRWKTPPIVGPYAGSKAPIPSNPVEIEPAEAPIYRIAGGWDVDVIFTDLGSGDFVGAVLNAAAIDAARKVEAAVATAVLAAAVPVDVTGITDPFGVIAAVVGEVVGNGASATFIGVAPDVLAAILSVSSTNAPWWLVAGPGGTVSISGRSGQIADVAFGVSSGLAAGQVVAGDRRAFTHYQTPNVRVQALNIPNGGIDIGLWLYAADLVNNAQGLAKAVVPVLP